MTETAADEPSYPTTTRLNELDVTFRLMTAGDRDAILAFTRQLPELDLLFLKTDITNPAVVDAWIRDIERGRTLTLLAEESGTIVGFGSLQHSDILWTRHLGELSLLVSSTFRGKGIGGTLGRQVVALAEERGFQKLMVQMMSTLRSAQNLFHHLGFIPEAMLHDWVIDRNGRTHDLILMSREVDEAGI